jgi:hypothetical protein
MTRSIPALMVLMLASTVAPSGAQDSSAVMTPPSNAEWRGGIDRIVRDLRAHHPDPFVRVGELTFLRRAEALKAALPSLSEEARVAGAMRLVAGIGDGHTQLEPRSARFALWYPLRLYEFTDGIFVTGAHRSVADLAGAQILEIAGRPAAEVVAAARELMGADNASDAREKLFPVHNAALMKGLGFTSAGGELKVRARLAGGRTVERTIAPRRTDMPGYGADDSSFEWRFRPEVLGPPVGTNDEWVSAFRGLPSMAFRTRDTLRPPHLVLRRALVARPLAAQDAYYIQANAVANLPDESFVAFFRRTLREVERQRPRRLIVDLRYNFGGDGSQVAPMIREFVARQDDPPWRELYVLTGRRTFSAGVMMLDAFLDHLAPTLVGEAAGAPLNSYGDANALEYPRLGLNLIVSHERHQLASSADVSERVPVDVPASFSFVDYAAGRDPAVDPILRGDEMRSIPAIVLERGADAARRVYEERRARFAGDPAWEPPSEIALRRVMRRLEERGDTAAALAAAVLNSEINPGEWRTWYNLGNLQASTGQMAASIASYRRSLALDDPTNFNAERLKEIVAEAEKSGTR